MAETIRWGILSTGKIAHKFALGLTALDDAELAAVGSRTQESADAFGEEFDVPRRHASYEALAADADVDVIYVATPHPYHAENALLCLEAGKAVLCEKPFTINVGEAEGVVAVGCEAYPDCRTGLVWTSSDGLEWELGEELALTPFATTALGQAITAGGTDSGKPDGGRAVIASADEMGWGITEPLGKASSRIVAMDSDEEGIVAAGWEQRPGLRRGRRP